MANANRPSGLSPVRYLNGAKWNGGGRVYSIPSTDGNAYAVGDPVVLAGSADASGVATVILATAGGANLVTGCIVGMGGITYGSGYVDPNLPNTAIIPASKARGYYVLVEDDPMVIFEIQESGTAMAAADVSLNASLLSGTNNGFMSGWQIDNSTKATTAALQLKLLGLSVRVDNAFGLYAKWQVLINNHSFRTGVAGA